MRRGDVRVIVVLKGNDTPRVYWSKAPVAQGRAKGLLETLDAEIAIIYEPDPCPGRDKMTREETIVRNHD